MPKTVYFIYDRQKFPSDRPPLETPAPGVQQNDVNSGGHVCWGSYVGVDFRGWRGGCASVCEEDTASFVDSEESKELCIRWACTLAPHGKYG